MHGVVYESVCDEEKQTSVVIFFLTSPMNTNQLNPANPSVMRLRERDRDRFGIQYAIFCYGSAANAA